MSSICFVSPYIPKHLGGGERYLLDCARVATDAGHQVSVAVPGPQTSGDLLAIKRQYQRFLGHELAGVEFVASPLFSAAGFISKLFWTRQFDVMYYATDGSIFWSLANRNILHIQVPLQQSKSLLDRLKLLRWQVVNTNSEFTKKTIESWWKIKVDVVHWPMVDLQPLKNPAALLKKKQKIIVHVGRFFRQMHSKRQDVLVKLFKELLSRYPNEAKGWKLVLIGSVEDQAYADEVAQQAAGLPITLLHQVTRQELWQWYDKASIYWHATGFGSDPDAHPEKMEHFGITTLEAMSRGCVPIVLGQGGQPEAIGTELADLLWQTPDECVEITQHMISNASQRLERATEAIVQAQKFGEARFKRDLLLMIEAKS